ncbi:efflux RND transporter periplasmic adaptor subunit [Rhodobacter sp. M37P]|uniref:Efflux RND transporter periplasmic adaptor subunit n=1 Tax=Rhodobacter calidifons TaxID=2715277 RepID=A0ABX0G849_9RHOB|nr:efflux RND transporter periplasmic adaptor subunit [Rhodobacter calidifons]NHB77396.1 efflux RND transporter periplasmic adaptor subunit [Rhodobacter calidifons]
MPRLLLLSLLPAGPLLADPFTVAPMPVTVWKSVYGSVEARDRIPARSRIGGTLVDLSVSEGDSVTAGQEIARIVDDKLDFQLAALSAQREALEAQLANAETDLQRGEDLLKNGVTTLQRVDALRTQVDVLKGQIMALSAQADVVAQQAKEGVVLAPVAGCVLDVPVTRGAVLMPGEVVAVVGGGGTFLRLAVPERHATALEAGDRIRITEGGADREGRLARLYPLIEGGRVTADVEIENLPDSFVGKRMLVSLPVGERAALMVPQAALFTRAGLDFVTLQTASGPVLRSVVPGETHRIDGIPMVEVVTGLVPGDVVLPASEAAQVRASHD